ncbi:PQQ-binding-like beta-propeller repeat protein [Blastopirellula sp. JC732]|uniref:PQQ-binding-like beta-propeller repeat protein n=1 Tax=Blastopirellula sediminis TaxID=2894196 RepID=A0A9X1MRB2_9BACT|nr:PQQ-binding-like beta-propeller repeat protein [Blastopirellula sediminis]MCC9605254.1 PQQ-binding-like beta-propeller repeat protein [Blastopirellula sediminis]MCC9631446.1 PQQ-binding-like beta-propeller repeat protein [Blastopirellula sediminis]
MPRILSALIIAFCCAPLQADWPLFRGDPVASGVAAHALPDKLELLWKYKVEKGAFEGTPAVVDGVVYIGDLDGAVYALSLADGKELWKKSIDTGFYGSPAYRDGKVYLGDMDGLVYCLDAKTGDILWKFETGAEINGSVNFYQDKLLIGSQDASLYCLTAADGQLVWKYEIADQIRCMPTIVENRGFVAGCDAKLHIVDLDKGTSATDVPIDAPTGSTPAVHGDLVVFGTEGGTLYGIDWKQAQVRWTYEDERGRQAFRASAAVTDKQVIIGGRNKRIAAVDMTNGKQLWTFPSRGRIDSSPVIAGDKVYFGSADGKVYGLKISDGSEAWSYEAGGGFTGGPAISDDKLLIASDDGVVYCFGTKTKE